MGKPFPGPWTFKHHPWSREMHDIKSDIVVGQKAAQMGFTESALNKTFKTIDVDGNSVLYVLPANTPDASDFSTSRFDPALESSTHLSQLFTDVKNIHHKRAGHANLFIRGSRSRSQLKSVPVSLMVFDEIDEMVQENIPLAFERMSGQIEKEAFLISTPTIDKVGINEYFQQSTQRHFYFKCPHCSKQTELIFPECLVITADSANDNKIRDSYIICKDCGGRLEHDDKVNFLSQGTWIPTYSDRFIEGYYINQLYSMTVRPYELAVSFLKGQTNPAEEQEFYNSKLGVTHTVDGARITSADIEACMGTHRKVINSPPNAHVVMGVDVGKWIHYTIYQVYLDADGNDVNLMSTTRLLAEGKCLNFEELDLLVHNYGIHFTVIDANPEHRKALEFAQRFWGRVKLCYYGSGINSKQINVHDESEHTITVDRTSWIDMSMSRFRSKKIILPVDVSHEYREHIKAPVRIYSKDKSGNPVGKYVKGNEDDHFAHAHTYAEIAIPLSVSIAQSKNIGSIL